MSYLHVLTKIEFFWSTIQAGRAIPKLVAKIGRVFLKNLHFQFYLFIFQNSAPQPFPPPKKKIFQKDYIMCVPITEKSMDFSRSGGRGDSTKVYEFLLSKSKFFYMSLCKHYEYMIKCLKSIKKNRLFSSNFYQLLIGNE